MSPAAWTPAPTAPALPPAEVHVWRADLDVPPARLATLAAALAPDERARALRYRLAQHRDRWTAARGILRAILAAYLRRAPLGLALATDAFGKPFLFNGGEPAPLRFNLAHADEIALVAVSWRRDVGVDVERERPDRADLEIARRVFPAEEAEALARMPLAVRSRAFFALWTAHEAYAKAVGRGLDAMRETPPAAWTVRNLSLGSGYAAAVAVEPGAEAIRCWRWQAPVVARVAS
ncbi:MAG TPA: 4'-phosphopantetheinyl transferase superfamily protein [Methylomirabilota bacterium]|nr:4'-phosphopantetheinyl transferase superfamily protein [Methylomirabilota bacterium]